MPHEAGLVDLGFPEPAGLLGGEKDFHCDFLRSPATHPHLTVAAFADLFHHLDLLGDCPLHLVGGQKVQV